jgi:phosphate starvation-inducible protein PhoH and related proteins
MAKRPERTRKASQANYSNDSTTVSFLPTTRFVSKRKKAEPLEPQTDAQEQYLFAMQNSQLIFALGPAGTGKTYVASAYAADLLQSKDIEQIIITRPNVEVGAGFGFLPGELEEKYAPYLAPFREVMIERMGLSQYEYALKAETISPRPLAFMRGATFNDAFVILDEAQNCTPAEMKMFLTRIGKNCTVVVDGDPEQCDLHGPSGLDDAVNRLERIPGVSVVEFTEDDIVRSGLIKDILCAYRN